MLVLGLAFKRTGSFCLVSWCPETTIHVRIVSIMEEVQLPCWRDYVERLR